MIKCAKPVYNLRHRTVERWPMAAYEVSPARRGLAPPAAPRVGELLDGLDVIGARGALDRPVTGLCRESAKVAPGMAFFALPDSEANESFIVEQAIERGAALVVTAKARWAPHGVTVVQVRDVSAVMATVAKRFHGFDESAMALHAVTGGHGKTTSAHLLRHMLGSDRRTALLSSICYDLCGRKVPARQFTPEAGDLYGVLAEARQSGCRQAIVEMGARSVVKRCLSGMPLESMIFLNGFDGMESTEDETLARIAEDVSERPPGVVAVNLDDNSGRNLIQRLPEEARVVRFGVTAHADIRASEISIGPAGMIMRIHWPEGSARVRVPLTGRFHVSNILGAAAAAWGTGEKLELMLSRLASFEGAPGRMQVIDRGQPFHVIVDAARAPSRLIHALRAARELTRGRLLLVFGCSGQMPRQQRPRMVEAAQHFATFCWATSDDPGFEQVGHIFNEMRAGVIDPKRIAFIDDRERAIDLALSTAAPGDLVFIVGKGDEPFQHVSGVMLPFDDRRVACEFLASMGYAFEIPCHDKISA